MKVLGNVHNKCHQQEKTSTSSSIMQTKDNKKMLDKIILFSGNLCLSTEMIDNGNN